MKIDYVKDYYSLRTLNNFCDEAYTCPACKSVLVRAEHRFCPDCGARLEWVNVPEGKK